MNKSPRILNLLLITTMLLSMFALDVAAAPPEQGPGPLRPVVIVSGRNDTSPPLRDIVPKPPVKGEAVEIPRFVLPKAEVGLKSEPPTGSAEAIVQNWPGETLMPSPILSFDGLSNDDNNDVLGFRIAPPDTQGDVGPNHYVQWVNLIWGVWDKDGNLLYGPAAGNTIWTGFGGACETTNDGDPITLYDQEADRWLMSQFALPGPNYQCIAISATGDPLGAWHRYEFLYGSKMNDYPKFGVWPDAYYMTANQFLGGWAGAGVVAYERDQMLQGNPAQMIYFDLFGVDPNFGGMLPADWDGSNPPPPGAPGIFAEWDDSTWLGDPDDTIRIWEFHVDWVTPANSTFGVAGLPNGTLATLDLDPNMCNYSRDCIPQPGTSQRVDAISDRLMHRLQYRNFGGYEALVSNHTVDVDSTDHAGLYWFELRNTGGGWGMYQEGVFAPDSDHRWMGSIAMDQKGNIALGYSVSSSSTYPSARYAGRLVSDPLGELTQGEAEFGAGAASQEGVNRWGDYSMMSVDPVDDCTFWTTQEYVSTPGTWNWYTRIGSFQFPGCMEPAGTLEGVVGEAGSGTPIIDAQVTAESDRTFVAYSQLPDGAYSFSAIPADTYTMTAQAYGYLPATVAGVGVFSGTTTVQDFSLTPAGTYLVEGTVTDATTGWPLYASIDVDGYPGDSIWNDPVTGYYSITLAAGITYTFNVEAWVLGYLLASRDVGPLTGNQTEDFGLDVEATCTAPGYDRDVTLLLSEDFDAGIPVTWNVVNNGGDCVWRDDDPGGRGNMTGGSGVFAIADSDYCGSGTTMNTDLETPAFDASGYVGLMVKYKNDYYDLGSTAQVDVFDGVTWTTVDDMSGASSRGPETRVINTPAGAGAVNAQVRWHYDAGWNWWWEVDEVRIYGLNPCTPQPGGLVVGNVYDDNTSAPLVGAEVANEDGYVATAVPIPDDPAVDDGFYTIFSPAGTKTFTATMNSYLLDVQTPTVVANDTIRQDFYLPAGWLSYDPASLETTLELGISTTLPFTLTNSGGGAAAFEFIELDQGMEPLGSFEEPTFWVKSFRQRYLTTERINLPEPPEAGPYAAGDIIQTWPTGLTSGWGLGYNTDATDMWISDLAAGGGTDLDYRFLTDGTNTGDTIDISWAGVFAADMTYNPHTGMLWQLDVGGDSCVHELDPVAMVHTGNTICPGWGVSQRGLAYDPSTDTYYVGGWNDLMIYHFASDGTMLDSANVGLATAGLSYNPDTQHLFVMVNADPNPVYVLDAADGYNLLGQFNVSAGFGAYGGAGLEMDCDGNLWAVDQNTKTVYQFESGETTLMCAMDVPWLSEDPISGTVGSGADVVVDVTFDAGVPEVTQPGTYYARLKIDNDTPYELDNVPVTMTITVPTDWGKLSGTVTGLGYCDTDPAPLEEAEVFIESSLGPTWTLTTDVSGTYQVWLDEANGPLTVTVTHPEHMTGTQTGVNVTGQVTTTVDFDLRWLEPCVSVEPTSMDVTVLRGTTETLTLTLYNDGAASTPFKVQEQVGTVWPPELLYQNLPVYIPPTIIADPPGGNSYAGGGYQAPTAPSGIDVPTAPARYTGPNALVFYGDRGTFDTDFPGLPVEDFENTLVADGAIVACPGPFDSNTNNACFAPGGILDGIRLMNSNPVNDMVVVGDGALGNPTAIVGPTTFADEHDIFFLDGGVRAVGFDLWAPLGAATFDIYIYGPGDVLLGQTTSLGGDVSGVFWGVHSDGPITRIRTESATGAGELFDDIAFGGAAADVPWLSEEPISGTVAADSFFDVTVEFTAFPTMTVGLYTATLVVASDDPFSGSIDIPVIMTVVDAPICGFTSSSPDDLGETTVFTNTTDEGYAATTYRWDFGDGSPISAVENPTHDYAHVGLYTVVLTAENAYGTGVCSDTVSIEGVEASFISNSPVVLGGQMVFTNTTLANPEDAYWFWTFGDSESSEDENPAHTYTEPGTYTVTLFVANVLGYAPGNVYDVHQATVLVYPYELYLPIVLWNAP